VTAAARLALVAALAGAAALVAGMLLPPEGHFEFESWPGFHAGVAVVAVAALAALTRVGRALLARREDPR